jgi:alpha-beta hydrolase superfamily lysophospholipase
MNWAKLDPWFTIRLPFHLWHSNSPLSHPRLVQRAFFGDKYPLASVVEFQRHMNRYESYLWPFSMMKPFASAGSILEPIARDGLGGAEVLVMGGSQDAIVTPDVIEKTAAYYRKAGEQVGKEVLIELIDGAGHHLQNDVQWEDGAAKLLAFIKGVA